ncbi:MAG: ribosome small subunit-dependent GTPase A [Thermoguttaceae bacterium]|nr:ribosome small subunit-dependent GTPase A [Thermoguttaceae bacterium]MDW8039457.1 ribosome small subunit-dependent GTPase A [Thermoguttaceae bacterium]
MASKKERKHRITRAELRKNRTERTRTKDWTRFLDASEDAEEVLVDRQERLTGKGDLTRRRTVRAAADAEQIEDPTLPVVLEVDERVCRPGRVLSVHGLWSEVQDEDGRVYRCTTRRLLKTLQTEQRHIIAVGDRVMFRPINEATAEGVIERVEPRRGILSRSIQGRQQIIVANVEQVLVVCSAAEPPLKPNLIDRMLIAAEKGQIRPVICINKIDLVDPAQLQPLVGLYSQMGYQVLLLSAQTGWGLDRLRRVLKDRQSVVAGQSGVGKSSLLNALDPRLQLRVAPVSPDTHKGRHTTTTARLIPLCFGGYVVDTPGIRQFELWDVAPAEVVNFFRDFRPYINLCKFPDCTHTHEADCAVKNAVADGRLDERRYESYCRILAGELESQSHWE